MGSSGFGTVLWLFLGRIGLLKPRASCNLLPHGLKLNSISTSLQQHQIFFCISYSALFQNPKSLPKTPNKTPEKEARAQQPALHLSSGPTTTSAVSQVGRRRSPRLALLGPRAPCGQPPATGGGLLGRQLSR